MKKRIAVILLSCMLSVTVFPATVFSDETGESAQATSETENTGEAGEAESAGDDLVTTQHTVVIKGEEIAYTATTGTMVVDTGGEQGEFFFRAYTKDDVEDLRERPITFAFNGGPGSCSYYLELGCLGPRRAEMTETGQTSSLPAKIVDNENSLLDITDLVFIDAIGTGYSRPVNEDSLDQFIGYENDIRSFADFIRQYINRNKRWSSEKYIAGESYGTTRAVGICQYLADNYAINVNGLLLISTLNDFSTAVPATNNERSYALYFPTFAADAWYHKMLDDKYQKMELEEFLDEVREFASTVYMSALFRGNRIKDKERDMLAEKMSSYIGLSKDYILSKNLRISLDDFCTTLLRDKNLMVGRNDGRFTGPIVANSLDDSSADPSSVESSLIFGNTFYQYVTDELNYQTDLPYVPANGTINNKWTAPESPNGWIGGYFSQEDIIYKCMSNNPYLKLWVICGYYDSATPFYAAEWTYSHVFLNDESKDNLTFSYYHSGHMFYLEKESFDQFRKEAESWYKHG